MMKKFLVIILCAVLALMMPAAVFADDGGEGAGGEETQQPDFSGYEVLDCDDVLNYATWYDAFYWNGDRLPGNGMEVAEDYMSNPEKYRVDTRETIGMMGWVCFQEKVITFGYMINGVLYTSEDFFYPCEAGFVDLLVSWYGDIANETACRYLVTVPITGLYGENEIVAVAVLESEEIVKLNSIAGENRDTTITLEFEPDPNATPTPEPTEAPTPAPTAVPTEAPVVTEAPTAEPTAEPTPEPKNSGCGNVLGAGSFVLLLAAAAAVVLKKKG